MGVVLLAALWGSAAQAGQIVVMDQTWVHGPDMPDSHFRVPPMDGTPGNWVSPVDYTQGSAWVYLEVHSKPTQQPTRFQVCFEATPTYACTYQAPDYTDVGVYEWETPFANFYVPPGESVDWTLGINKLACILKDTMNGKPSANNVGPEVAALYMPTEVRMVVTLVEAGSVYEPPTPSGEGTTGGESSSGDATGGGESSGEATTGATSGDATSGDATSGDATSGDATTGTPATTGDATTGAPVTTGTPDDPTTGAGSATTGGGEGGSDSTGAPEDTSKDAGCSCSARSTDARAALALIALVFGLVRRRR